MGNIKIIPAYLNYRNHIFDIKKASLKLSPNEEDAFIYGAVVDIKMKKQILTLVCFINGKANLCVSDRDGVQRDGGKYESVDKATKSFLMSANKVFNTFSQTDDFGVQYDVDENVFLFTDDGIYNAQIKYDIMGDKEHAFNFLQFLYKNIFTELKNSKAYSCMVNKCSKCILGNLWGDCMLKRAIE